MKYGRFYDNIVSVIKEAQIKLGYEEHTLGINYIARSLCHLLGCSESKLDETLRAALLEFSDTLGQIEVTARENGYRLDVPEKGVRYVHSLLRDDEFLSVFIHTVKKPLCTVDDIRAVFERYSDSVHFEEVNNGEFDYLIYFEDSGIDDFWYCIHSDELALEYHRFIKEDYLDFNF